tara:strand:+ start:697 stop:1164 length:468 start_codon:yes stop_codon:yes gene_type:complete
VAITKLNVYSLGANSVDSDHYVDTSIDNAHLADDAVGVAELSATGTASATTFLRGDNAWTAVGGAYSDWTILTTTPTTLVAKGQYVCNDTTARTHTLPAGSAGDTVIICNAGTGTVTVGRNGSEKINSVAADGTLTDGNSVQLVYVDGTIGWFEV